MARAPAGHVGAGERPPHVIPGMVAGRAPTIAVGSVETERSGWVIINRAVTDQCGYQKGKPPSSAGEGKGKNKPGKGKDKQWSPYY